MRYKVDGSYWKMGIFFQINLEVIRTVGSKCFCFGFAKDICILIIFLWNREEVDFFRDDSRFGLHCGMELESKYFRA